MMKRTGFVVFLVAAISLCTHGETKAQDGKAPWWNPFSSSQSDDRSTSQDDFVESSFFDGGAADDEPLFKLPKFTWRSGKSSTKTSAGSSSGSGGMFDSAKSKVSGTFGKMTSSTKRFWSGTVDFLNPFDDSNREKIQQGYQPQNMQESSQSGSLFGGFGWGSASTAEDSRPRDVNDFLRGSRPRF